MNSSILVTGASGFLGRHLVGALQNRSETVVTHSSRDGDLATLQPQAAGVRHVFHLAARTYVPDSWKRPVEFYQTNVLGTANVLEYCRASGASFTLVSSYMYGRPEHLPISEDHPLRAFNPYGHSKLLAEELARFYRDSFGLNVSIVRPFNLYGPGQSKEFLIPTLIGQALAKDCDSITVADLAPKRDYIYIDDVVDLLIRLGVTPDTGGTYNAGTGLSTSVQELAQTIAQLAGTSKPIVSRNQARPNEVLDTVADIRRAEGDLGWRPRVSLRDGLKRTIDAFREPARPIGGG
jgi:nucleoside-diphosphate-sugar epimerase